MDNMQCKVKQLVSEIYKGLDVKDVKELKTWNEVRVFCPVFEKTHYIGPQFVLVEGDAMRLANANEVEEYLEFCAN